MHDRRPHFETLEPRLLLAVATVDTELDVVDLGDGVTSLREAIFAANTLIGPDTIEFDPSLAGKTILLTQGELQISDDLTINGLGADLLTIDAGNGLDNVFANGDGTRIFNIDDGDSMSEVDVSISSIRLTGGDSANANGGAIWTMENLSISNSTISGNATSAGIFRGEGGGIYSRFGDLTVIESTISENSARGHSALGGGLAARGNSVSVSRSNISGNTTISHAQSFSYGAGIFLGGGSLSLVESTVSGNQTEGIGGGGGISIGSGHANIVDSWISRNTADEGSGGGIHLFVGEIVVMRSTIEKNTAGAGGGLYSDEGHVTISHSTFNGNSANFGGGVYLLNFNESSSLISNSTITDNTAASAGGGVTNGFGSTVIRNSTITRNTAPAESGGGVASNGLSFIPGSGIATTELLSSIVADNTNGDLAVTNGEFNSFQTLGYNLIGSGNTFDSGTQNATDNFTNNDLTAVSDPQLAPLADNGGPTLTHAPLPGSPAIDAGDPNAVVGVNNVPEFDQRGFPFQRIANGDDVGLPRIDIGALELQDPPADFDLDGDTDGRDFLFWQRGYNPTATTATKGDGDADGDMDVDGDDRAAWESSFGVGAELSAVSSQVSAERPLAAELVDLAMAVALRNIAAAQHDVDDAAWWFAELAATFPGS